MSWLFVPGLEASNSDCAEPCLTPEPFVMSRGKPLPPRALLSTWKRAPWIRRLSGLTYAPSIQIRGLGWWIASLAATRASLSASPANDEGPRTLDTSGLTSPSTSPLSDRSGASSRTFGGISHLGLMWSHVTFARWVTELKRESLQRRKSARLTNAQGSSSWPTPTAQSYGTNQGGGMGRKGAMRPSLETLAKQWPTPTVNGNYNQAGLSPTSGDGLATVAHGLHRPETCTHGGPCKPTLNPLFVEWLMGFPIGWTDLEPLVTPSARPKQHTPGEPCALDSEVA
jgi:hypothetical protein